MKAFVVAAALTALPLAVLAQTTVTNKDTGETIVIDGPPLEAPLAVNLFRYLNQGEKDAPFRTKFEHLDSCLYRMTLIQKLDPETVRTTVTTFNVRDLSMDGYQEAVYAPDVASLILPFSDGVDVSADITLDGPDNETRKAYRDAIEMTCTDTRCEGRMPTEQVHLTILTPTAENDVGFANMSMGALMNACRPQEQE